MALVDVAVHSLKDLPTQGPDELLLAAVPAREDVADALIAPEYQTIQACPRAHGRHRLADGVEHSCCSCAPTCKSYRFGAMSRRG